MTSLPSKKNIVIFATDDHSGQLNPILAMAKDFWHSCDQSQTEIHFISNGCAKDKVLQTLPQAQFVSTGIPKSQSLGGAIQKPGYYESTLRGQAGSVRAMIDIYKLILDPDAYRKIFTAVSSYLDSLPQSPQVAIVDGLSVAISDAMRQKKVPRIVNIPFNANACLDISLLGSWTFPNAGTGYSDQMSLGQKIYNRLFLFTLKMSLLVMGIRFVRLRNNMANIPLSEANDYVGISEAKHFLVDTVFDFEYEFELPSNVSMIGACIDEEEIEEQFQNSLNKEPTINWIEQHASVVFIGLGTITKLNKEYVLNLLTSFQRVRSQQPDTHLLFKIPDGCYRPDEGDPLLANVRIVNRVHSQLEVLRHPHVKVFVSHCGGNGVHEGIFFGKAILGIPQWTDCYDFAQRVEDSGVGLRVHQTVPNVDSNEVSDKLLQLLTDEKYRLKSISISQTMKKAGGIKYATKRIHQQIIENNADGK